MASPLRTRFDRELADLSDTVLVLGSRARAAVASALRAFLGNDLDAVGDIIAGDRAINDLRYEIEQQCYGLLAREQPVAGDMRAIIAALTIASELERIGDHGKKIARICERTSAEPRPIPCGSIDLMGEIALAMLDDALQSVATRNPNAARAVPPEDNKVDALYKQTFNETLTHMLGNPRAINAGTYVIQVAHELERVADRATNIAERVIYAASGDLVDLNA